MYSFPYLEPVHCSMSHFNCCFLTCIQISLLELNLPTHCNKMFPGESLLNVGLMVAQMAKNHLQCRRSRFNQWVGKILWRREWLATPVLLPEEFQGQRSLASYSPWGPKESDTTEWLSFSSRKLLFCKDNILSISPYFVLVPGVFIQLFFISYGRFIIVIGKRVRLIQATPPVSRTG